MPMINKYWQSNEVDALACTYLSRLLQEVPELFEHLQETEPQDLPEFYLAKEDLTSKVMLKKVLTVRMSRPVTGPFASNSQSLCRQMGDTSGIGLALLQFVTIYTLHQGLQEALTEASYLSEHRTRLSLLAALIEQPVDELNRFLVNPNWMVDVDMLWREPTALLGLSIRMDLGMAERLFHHPLHHPLELVANCLEAMPGGDLTLTDYQHMSLGNLVEHARQLPRMAPVGWNTLLWGRPGTGKTQFACLLAREAGMTLYSLRCVEQSRYRQGAESRSRLRDLLLAQRLLSGCNNNMLLVDEADDLLGQGAMPKQQRHQLLEKNPVPVIWTTNDITQIETATLRRFNWLQRFEHPDADVRLHIYENALRGCRIPKQQILIWAGQRWMSPGDICRMADVIKGMGLKGNKAVMAIERWMWQREQAITAASHSPHEVMEMEGSDTYTVYMNTPYRMEGVFNPGLLNLQGHDSVMKQDIEVGELLSTLIQAREGRVLLHGKPGTGKTALVHYIGEQIGCSVVKRLGSDLLQKYVGESEKLIAAAFTEATERRAILFLDEVDSLLSDRRGHYQGWETSQVNELLQQIEQFTGMLVIATNFIERLDSAVARRFDYQIELHPLATDQLMTALEEFIDFITMFELSPRLSELGDITLGDIAVLKRRQRLQRRILSADEIINILSKLVAGREKGNPRPMGFVKSAPIMFKKTGTD